MKITYMTHASIKLQTEDLTLITDPYYIVEPPFDESVCHFPPHPGLLENLGQVDYVYCSHIHNDHAHRETFQEIKDRVGHVLLPADRDALVKVYTDLGFDRITLIQNGETLKIREGYEITSFWCDPVDTAMIAVVDGVTILHMNDCMLDGPTLHEIASRFTIDYAFVMYTVFGDLFPLTLPRSNDVLTKITRKMEDEFFHSQRKRLEILKPRTVIPYSNTIAYFQPDQVYLNGLGRQLPTTFCKRMAQEMPDSQYLALQPGDIIDSERDEYIPVREGNWWGDDTKGFVANINRYRATNPELFPPYDYGDPADVDASFRKQMEKRFKQPFKKLYRDKVIELHIEGTNVDIIYLVDIKNKTINVSRELTAKPFIKVKMPVLILRAFLQEKYKAIPMELVYTYKVSYELNEPLEDLRREFNIFSWALISMFSYEYQLQQFILKKLEREAMASQ